MGKYKQFILTVLITALVTSTGSELITTTENSIPGFFYSVLLIFSWLIIPTGICVLIFYGLKPIYKRLNIKAIVIIEMLSLLTIYAPGVILFNLPGYLKHKEPNLGEAHFASHYTFIGFIVPMPAFAILFSIVIPLTDWLLPRSKTISK